MFRKFMLLSAAMLTYASMQAQDSTSHNKSGDTTITTSPATIFSGSLDLYYRYNFANAPDSKNNYTSFTNSQNSLELGMATIRADHNWAKAGITVELGFGRRAQDFSYNDGVNNSFFSLSNIVQAYAYYNITDKIKLTAGKWGTHIGYEVVDAYVNRNYSMSYMFTYGPFFNTGLKADIAITGKTAIMIGISNPTDNSTTLSVEKMAIAQISTATPNNNWKFYLNYQGGTYAPQATMNQFDLVVNGTVTDKFGIGFNATDQMRKTDSTSSQSWWGTALYLNYDFSSKFGLTLRGEYFNDDKNLLFITPNGGSFTEFTLTGQIKLGKLTFMPELRYDAYSTDQAFLNHDDAPTKNTFTGLLAATYVF